MPTESKPMVTAPGLMMDVPLGIGGILKHALRNHAERRIVSRDGEEIVSFTYGDFGRRCAQLAAALHGLGVRPGDRVASFAWNTHRHLELYYSVPSYGAILHTANIRLFPDQVAYVIEHADDKVIFVDASLTAVLAKAIEVRPAIASRTYVVMGKGDHSLPNAHDYEELIASQPAEYDWPTLDEHDAAMLCYTSATTGEPKGALFSHRSTYLHALAANHADYFSLSRRDAVLPVVPMFHVNAWGIPFAALMAGTKIVMPGTRLDPASLIDLLEREHVTFSAGVPTVWLAVRDALRASGKRLPKLERLIIGGSAVPPQLLEDLDDLGIRVVHAWGMTEMSPLGTCCPLFGPDDGDDAAVHAKKLKQGKFHPLVAWRVLDESGNDVPQDGTSHGELWVRGPAVVSAYYKNEAPSSFRDGFFRTGDIVTVDDEGFIEIVDRSKDLIKSGGEWISSVDLENTLMGHPAVREACVFGVPHPKWDERPIAAVVVREGQSVTEDDLRSWLGERMAKWQIPDRVLFIDAIPRTGVGKFLKRELRDRYKALFSTLSSRA
ncbi:MAG: long-chain fatty acid--CoA ligase [Vulcanimicrobiaceae bacterium]